VWNYHNRQKTAHNRDSNTRGGRRNDAEQIRREYQPLGILFDQERRDDAGCPDSQEHAGYSASQGEDDAVGKQSARLHPTQPFFGRLLTAHPDSVAFPPITGDVHCRDRVNIVAPRRPAAMRHKVHLHVAQFAGIPICRYLHRHLLVDQPLYIGIPIAPQMPHPFLPPQQPVDGARRNLMQPPGHHLTTADLAQLPQTFQFTVEHRYHALSTRLFEYVPYLHQRSDHRCSIFGSPFAPLLRPRRRRMVEYPNQILPIQARPFFCLIQQTAAAAFIGPPVLSSQSL
jgi:hypothetical protein